MEALIYNESPIAEYLEGDAIPFEAADPPSPSHKQTFAPRGLPKLRERLRKIRQTAASVTDVSNERFLEQFRYVIVASQLLSDEPKPRRQFKNEEEISPVSLSFKGALITAGISFFAAFSLHLLQRRGRIVRLFASSWLELGLYTVLFAAGCVVLYWLARRQYLDFVRQSASCSLRNVTTGSLNFDSIASEALRFVQEVEVVSRGYDM
jgi:hypothetical protein